MSDYIKYGFIINPYNNDAANLLAAFLADEGFESFVDTPEGMEAYVVEEMANDDSVKTCIAQLPFQDINVNWEKELINHQDWNEEWEKNYFQPLVLADGRCVVHSSFHKDYPKAEFDIVVDPKMAFGTGHHATTTMMVGHLFKSDLADKKVLDMGTGTGILAIIAKKLGAKEVTGIEIDAEACRNAVDNAAMNDVDIALINGDARALNDIADVDIFLANINRNIILADLDRYVASMKEGGHLVLSGFYVSDIPILEAALNSQGLKIEETATEGEGWASIKAVKKA